MIVTREILPSPATNPMKSAMMIERTVTSKVRRIPSGTNLMIFQNGSGETIGRMTMRASAPKKEIRQAEKTDFSPLSGMSAPSDISIR